MRPESVRTVFEGNLISLEVQTWPGSRRREVVHHPGACAIVALTPSGDVVLVRQLREAVRESLLEIPAGILDQAGESAVDCAMRELLEETGYRAERIQPLATIYTSPGFADERIAIFLAEVAEEAVADGVEDGVEVVRLPLAEAVDLIERGEITDAKTVGGLLLAERER